VGVAAKLDKAILRTLPPPAPAANAPARDR